MRNAPRGSIMNYHVDCCNWESQLIKIKAKSKTSVVSVIELDFAELQWKNSSKKINKNSEVKFEGSSLNVKLFRIITFQKYVASLGACLSHLIKWHLGLIDNTLFSM